MLNICFSSNAAIMLKLAGKQNTVFLLDDLSVGLLKTQNYEHRFEEFYSIYGYRMEDREREKIIFLDNYKQLIDKINHNDTIRIWYSYASSEYIGMLYICSIVSPDKTVYLTNCSEYIDDCIAVSLLEDTDIIECLRYQAALNPDELQIRKNKWEQLLKNDGKLRVYDNKLIASDAYFDDDIKELLNKNMKPLDINSEIYHKYLTKKRIIISDGYIYERARQLSNKNKIAESEM